MDMAKMYQSLGEVDNMASTMSSARELMDEMAQTRKSLAELKSSNSRNAFVDLYLSKRSTAMGVGLEATNKKQKND